ncbi:hypothetical protein SAMN02746041_01081 [Desulfacinum hydrothermale DSM 13146]|uniref:AMIN domain-containing protein n=1 Tax=Desulfacinum hydrothermale DSM 13146 TaxID=1121390 RepID=A0A1W1XAN8_9BACT|nr:DUF1302 family protein [Desulfacinum hydrothermale]SMC20996.1 hypothetical protein SAMN02746041_01081 [Desulfacinum hydrothermale DSM 13146]
MMEPQVTWPTDRSKTARRRAERTAPGPLSFAGTCVLALAGVLACLLGLAAPAAGTSTLRHALYVSATETRLQIETPVSDPAVRTSFLDSPRRFVAEVSVSNGQMPAQDRIIPVPSDPRVASIALSQGGDHVRYTFLLRKGAKVQYRVLKGASIVTLVLRSAPSQAIVTQQSARRSHSTGPRPSAPSGPSRFLDPGPQDGGQDAPSSPQAAQQGRVILGGAPMGAALGTPAGNATDHEKATGPLSNVRLRGFVEATGAQDLKRDHRFEQTRTFRNRVRLEAKLPLASPPGKTHFLVSAESDLLWFGPHRDWNDHDVDLYEAYLHWAEGPWEVRVGKQIVRWGKTDQLSPVDNLNPQDLRQFVVPTLEERKIPTWMARLRFFHRSFSLEAVAIPFFEPADLDYFGTDWAIFRHTREVLEEAPLPPFLRHAAASVGVDEDEPPKTFRNTQWGVRTGITVGGWDLAASYLYGWNPMPFVKSFPVKGIRTDGSFDPAQILTAASQATWAAEDVAVGYRRTHTVGLEWETVLGNYGFRGETAFTSHGVFLTSDLTSVTQPVLFTVIGIDRTWADDWYANLQLGHQVLLDYGKSVLYFKRHNVSVNGEIRKDLFRGDLEARLRAMVLLTDGGSFWNPSLTVRRFAPLSITTGLKLFAGPSDTFFGTYSDNDQAYVTVRYNY